MLSLGIALTCADADRLIDLPSEYSYRSVIFLGDRRGAHLDLADADHQTEARGRHGESTAGGLPQRQRGPCRIGRDRTVGHEHRGRRQSSQFCAPWLVSQPGRDGGRQADPALRARAPRVTFRDEAGACGQPVVAATGRIRCPQQSPSAALISV